MILNQLKLVNKFGNLNSILKHCNCKLWAAVVRMLLLVKVIVDIKQ